MVRQPPHPITYADSLKYLHVHLNTKDLGEEEPQPDTEVGKLWRR